MKIISLIVGIVLLVLCVFLIFQWVDKWDNAETEIVYDDWGHPVEERVVKHDARILWMYSFGSFVAGIGGLTFLVYGIFGKSKNLKEGETGDEVPDTIIGVVKLISGLIVVLLILFAVGIFVYFNFLL